MARDELGSQDPTAGDPSQADHLAASRLADVEATRIVVVFESPVTEVPGPEETQIVASESALTSIIRTDAPAKRPVFVDPSGRRGRRVRRWAYGIGVLVLLIVAAAWVVQLDGWAKPPTPASSVAK